VSPVNFKVDNSINNQVSTQAVVKIVKCRNKYDEHWKFAEANWAMAYNTITSAEHGINKSNIL
jgi:hypothetical protein